MSCRGEVCDITINQQKCVSGLSCCVWNAQALARPAPDDKEVVCSAVRSLDTCQVDNPRGTLRTWPR